MKNPWAVWRVSAAPGADAAPWAGWRVFLASFTWFACTAWLRPLALPDEGRYVGVALEMLRSGDWTTPTLDGLPFFHKPPLFYWITALALDRFGTHVWAARVASMLAGAAAVTLLHASVRDWLGARPARIAALVLATQPLFYGSTQYANLDALVASCICAAVLLGARALLHLEAGAGWRRELAAAYGAAALGVLAKGLIGGVFPVLVLGLWLVSRRRWHDVRLLVWWPGWVLFLVIVLPWHLAAERAHPGFLHYYFVVQQFQRYATTGFNNPQPFWFYLPVLLLGVFPWSGWLLPRIAAAHPRVGHGPAVVRLMWIWLATVAAFFSAPQSKLIGYILPALPPLAVLAALAIGTPVPGTRRHAAGWVCLALALCIDVGTVVGVARSHPNSARELALTLGARRAPGEGIAFIDDYVYDVPFYLDDTTPVFVVADWDPEQIQRHDNGRRELSDAGAFAPALAAQRLLGTAAFARALCDGRIGWVIAPLDGLARLPVLARAPRVAANDKRVLVRTDVADPLMRQAWDCH
ncbi:MAG: glycosyltransferase family 39 protein [Pseudomonadota bacterium]|nr:glycosyltransferase family 39 protein [Pseudomonadota bacterium]